MPGFPGFLHRFASPRLRGIARVVVALSLPLFLLASASAIRSLWIGTNDLFHFGQRDRWWCYTIIHFGHIVASLDTYEPGTRPRHSGPAQSAGSDWFYDHLEATGGTWALIGEFTDRATHTAHNFGFFGYTDYYFDRKLSGTTYWLHLKYFPITAFFVSGAILASWVWSSWQRRRAACAGLCPTCRYDLRAHTPGQICPECGTPFRAQASAIPSQRQ
jgi:hypothetical protein